jgi:hypothetical protein
LAAWLFIKTGWKTALPFNRHCSQIKLSASSGEGTLLPQASPIIHSPAQSTRTELTPAVQPLLELFFSELAFSPSFNHALFQSRLEDCAPIQLPLLTNQTFRKFW